MDVTTRALTLLRHAIITKYNVKHQRAGHTSEPATFSWHCDLCKNNTMHQQQSSILSYEEGRIDLALQAFTSGQFKTLRRAAAAFSVRHQRLSDRLRGIANRHETRPNNQRLTATEEQTVIRYILDLDARGFAPRLCEVADIADQLLAARGGISVGKNWAERFVARTEELKMAFNRAKDRQRVLQEDSATIGAWFKLVRDTLIQYGVYPDDIHNFNETGFQMGVIGSMKVVTG